MMHLASLTDCEGPVTFATRINGQPKATSFDFHDDGHDDSGIGASLLSADLNHGKHIH